MTTANHQHPTSNIRCAVAVRRVLDVGGWLFSRLSLTHSPNPRTGDDRKKSHLRFFSVLRKNAGSWGGGCFGGVRGSALFLLFACLGGGFVTACLSAGEPSTLATAPTAIPPRETPVLRALESDELVTLLTETLQRETVKAKGELELRLTRPWNKLAVPDAPLTLKITELPNAGIMANCIVRFELRTDERKLGEWQASLQAKVWREVWVARSAAKRGLAVMDADLARERRDVINVREALADFSEGDATLELAEPLAHGAMLLARSVKPKTVIRRGQLADALVEDGALRVTMKVEVLEDGAPGQMIRARNPQSRRDLRGRVLNEQTILLSL